MSNDDGLPTAADVRGIMAETAGLYEALAAAQAEIKNPEKTHDVSFSGRSYKYADLADTLAAILPVFSKHGLSIMQPTRIEGDQLVVSTVVTHKSGQSVTSDYPVCAIQNEHQKMGASLTYARRYSLSALCGVTGEFDSDGMGAAKASNAGTKKMSVHQAKKEVNWDAIEKNIREAKTERLLDNMAARVTENEGSWPDSYVTNAREEIEARRREINAEAAEAFEAQSEAELDEMAQAQ